MKRNFWKRGIGTIELIIIAAVLGIIVSVVLPQLSQSRERAVLNGAVGDILSSLNKARSQTLAGADSSAYGVRLEADKVIIFKGAVFSAGAPGNEEINILSPAGITNVTLGGVNGVSGELYFNRLSGTPSKSGTITLSSTSLTKVITISATGAASAD